MENTKKTVNFRKQVFRDTKEVYVSTDLDLPDYCPDIRRILQCSGNPCIESTFMESERASMDGLVVFRLLYTAEDGTVHAYESEQRYNAAVRCGSIASTDILFCSQKCESVRYRAVGPRRVEMNLIVSVQFDIDAVSEMSDISEAPETVQMKKTETAGYTLQALAECPFVLEETFSPKNENLSQASVISEQLQPMQNEIKIVKDKVLIKGLCEAEFKCLESETQTILSVHESVPFSQIFSVPGVEDTDTVHVIFHTQHSTLTIRDTGECELRLQIIASLYAYRDASITAVTDAFSTTGGSVNEFEVCAPIDKVFTYSDSISAEENEPATEESMEDSVVTVIADAPKIHCRAEKEKIILSGCIPATVVLHGGNGWHSVHKDINISAERAAADIETAAVFCSGWKQNITCSKSGGMLLLKADVNYSVFALSEKEIKVVRTCSEESNTDPSVGHIGLLFAEQGEELWDIAKENRIDLSSLRTANGLEDCDTIPENMILLLTKQ